MVGQSETLIQSGWLSEQSRAFQQWIIGAGRWRHYSRNEQIFAVGEPADGLIGVAAGAVDIIYPGFQDKSLIVTREGRGFWVGDLAVLARKPRIVSAYAGVPTDVFFVATQAILGILRERPAYWHAFYQLAYDNQVIGLEMLSEALTLPVPARLARRLRHLAGADLTARISQQALADLLGTTRTHLQRSLAVLAEQGLIETGYNQIRIADLAGLNALAR